MNFLNDINDKTVIVCPSNVKQKILNKINSYDRLFNIKMYSLEELKKLVLFDYGTDTILYIMNKYMYSYEVTINYINNLYYVEDKVYNRDKLDFLVNLKKELIDNNLINHDDYFINCYKNTPFIVFGYDYLTSFDKKILSCFNYKFIDKNNISNNIDIYDIDTLEEEVVFVANKIIELIRNNVDINSIYLVNLDSSYTSTILRVFKMFNIPVDISNSSSILSTVLGKKAFELLYSSKSFSTVLEYIKNNSKNSYGDNIYKKILNIFNEYINYESQIDTLIPVIEYRFKNTVIDNNDLVNKVRVGSLLNSYYLDTDHVFLLGFNQGSIPRVFKDEDYINDKLKTLLGLDSVITINKMEREASLNSIKSINNICISFKRRHLDSEYYPSNLINDFNVIKVNNIETSNSLCYSEIKLSNMLDNLIKYDVIDNNLSSYYNSFDIRYMGYDNKFKGISKSSLFNYLSNKLTLSYSVIDSFFKCQFRYYIDNILKLNKYDETFDTILGSLFHYVLSHVYDKDFNIDRYYDYFLKDKELTKKDKFYLDKLKKELIIICDRLLEFQNDTGLTNVFTEKNIKIDKSSDISVIFKGIVDKIMYKEYDNKTLVAIIDYKTGFSDIDLFNSYYGIGMQLIVYLYLIQKSNLFNNYEFVGFYLQKILSNEVNIDKNKSYLDIKYDNLKLYGYSCDDLLQLQRFDPSYENSKYIKGLKTTKTGFSAYSKVISKDTMNSLVLLVDKKIDEARDKILDCDFSINPKHIGDDKDVIGCKYCRYNDICFRKNDDIVNLKEIKDLSFLKVGETDAKMD